MRSHSPGEGPHSAKNQPAIKRRGDRATFVLNAMNFLQKIILLPGNYDSAENVAMAAKIFGGRMHNQIGSKIERALQNGRPGIVANANCARLMNDLRERREIDNFEQRDRE